MVQRINNRIWRLSATLAPVGALAGILLLLVAATPSFAGLREPLAVVDDGGVDDVAGNLDLNALTYDASRQASQGVIDVAWAWDVDVLPPDETATACAGFDSSGDGKADTMLCATLAISPTPSIASTVRYGCNGNSSVSCGAAAAQAPSAGSSCAAATTGDNFDNRANAEASTTQDTAVACTVAAADAGNGYLVNVCSYAGGAPTVAPSDCVFDPGSVAFLLIAKDAAGSSDAFDFTLNPASRTGAGAFSVNGGSQSAPIPVNAGVAHSLAEVVPSDWLLASADCSTLAGAVGSFDSNLNGVQNISANAGQTVRCTFDNDPPGRIVVQTTADRAGDYTFDFASDYTGSFTLSDGDSHDSGPLAPSTSYAVTEVVPMGWTVDATCTNGQETDGITLAAGSVVTCTFANQVQAAGIEITKTAPAKVNAGATVLYEYRVTTIANSAPLSNTILVDDTCESISEPSGDTISPTLKLLQAGETWIYHCSQVINIDTTNTATVTARTPLNDPVYDTGTAFVDVRPSVNLSKAVNKTSQPEPNATFFYTLTIQNTSNESVTITALTDDYPLSQACQNLLNSTIAAQGTAKCSYSVNHANAGVYNNTASVTVRDDENNEVSDTADVPVTVSDVKPTFTLAKTVAPATLPEPNAIFHYTLTITNTSVENIRIKSIEDDNPLSQQCKNLDEDLLAPQQVVSCHYDATFAQPGIYPNTATVRVIDDEDPPNSLTKSADATVTVTNVPAALSVEKAAEPAALTAPGGLVDFTITVKNSSTVDDVTLVELVEDADNDGSTDTTYPAGAVCAATALAPGAATTCTFSRVVTGSAGEVITDKVTVKGQDDDGGNVSASATADVGIYRADALVVSKIPSSASIPEPGGVVTFTIGVLNVHPIAGVKLTDLTDSVYGDVTTSGHDGISATTCALPTVAAGDQYVCTFTAAISGNANDVHANTLTVTGVNAIFGQFSGQATTQVTISDLPATLRVTKSPGSATAPEAGSNVTFTLQVRNTSVADPLVVNSIADSIFGNVTDSGNPQLVGTNCISGQTIPAGSSYTCRFVALLAGAIGAQHENTVTAKATDDEGVQRQAAATAVVTFVGARAAATKRDALEQDSNGNGVANPGDVIAYTIYLTNTGNTAGDFIVTDVVDPNLTLLAGTIAVSQGTVSTSANSFSVALASLPPNDPVAITYQARVKNPLAAGVTSVANQATVTSPTAPTVVSDDPDTLAANDATTTLVVAAPALALTKRDTLADDADQDGIASPGDGLAYQLILTNSGNQAASGVVIEDTPDGNTSLVSGSVTTSRGVVVTGNGADDTQVRVELSSPLAVGATVAIDFRVTVKAQLPQGLAELSNQALARAANLAPLPSDDPDTPAKGDPTLTRVSALPKVDMFKNDSLLVDADDNGVPSPGDTLAYNIEIVNSGSQNASALLLRDVLGANLSLVAGSVTRSQGDILTGNAAGDTEVLIDLGILVGNSTATVGFHAVIVDALPLGVLEVSNQASLSGMNFDPILSDDPDSDALDDPTRTTVTATPALRVSKRDLLYIDADGDEAVGPGDTLYYLLRVVNNGNVAATEVVLTDAPGSQTTLRPGTIQLSQGAVLTGNDSGDASVAVELGTVPAKATVNVAFRVVIDRDAVGSVSNQATVEYVDPNAAHEQKTRTSSDDPDTPAADDPTVTPLKRSNTVSVPLHLPLVFN